MNGVFVTLLGALLSLGLTTTSSGGGSGETYAVVVGIDEYVHNTIPTLRYAVSDAKIFAQALQDVVKVPKDHILVMTSDAVDENSQPKATNVAFQVGNLKGKVKPIDTLIFYFAGHGMTVGDDSYLLTEEADNRNAATLKLSALRGKDLGEFLRDAGAGRVIVMVDACRNNPSKPSNALDFAYPALGAGTGKSESATMFACSPGERSWEWDEKKHGFFTWFVVQGLRQDAADADGRVTLQGLATFVTKAVSESAQKVTSARQSPQIGYQGPGEDKWILSMVSPGHVASFGGLKKDADESKLVAQLEAARAKYDEEHAARVAAEARLAKESSRRQELEQRLAILEKQVPGGPVSAAPKATEGQALAYADRGAPGVNESARAQALEAEITKLKAENESLKARLTAAHGQVKEVGMLPTSSREVTLLEEECQKSEARAASLGGASLEAQLAQRTALQNRLALLEASYGPALAKLPRDAKAQNDLDFMAAELQAQKMATVVDANRADAAERALTEARKRADDAETRATAYERQLHDLTVQVANLHQVTEQNQAEIESLRAQLADSRRQVRELEEKLAYFEEQVKQKYHRVWASKNPWQVNGPAHAYDFTNIPIKDPTREATEDDLPQKKGP